MAETAPPLTMDTIVSLCRRRGFVFPSSEIYGGIGSTYDYGHYGVLTKNNIRSLWFRPMVQARQDASSAAYTRPETAQGIFVNFKNVAQLARRKPPFGIAQIGKAFRNEITPGNFLFRQREFELMEMEFFVPPDESEVWHRYWIETRRRRYLGLGVPQENPR